MPKYISDVEPIINCKREYARNLTIYSIEQNRLFSYLICRDHNLANHQHHNNHTDSDDGEQKKVWYFISILFKLKQTLIVN